MPDPTPTRRTTLKTIGILTTGIATIPTATARPGKPNFTSRVYGDGTTWGTKAATTLPAPTPQNRDSYDDLYAITNGAPDQLPVAEAAPGNPAYNGGRWITHTVEWTDTGMAAHDPLPVLTRYGPADDPTSIQFHANRGHLTITHGSPNPSATPDYFECPLLPHKP